MIDASKFKAQKHTAKASNSYPIADKGAYAAYVCDVELKQTNSGADMIVIKYDITKGEHRAIFTNAAKEAGKGAKWTQQGVIRFVLGDYDFQREAFENFLYAIQESNKGFIFDGDETKLKGKHFGAVLYPHEYWYRTDNDIFHGWRVECGTQCAVGEIDTFEIPKDKPLSKKQKADYEACKAVFEQFEAAEEEAANNPTEDAAFPDEDGLPF